MRTVLSDQLDAFASRLVGRTFGATRVTGATAYLDEDSAGDVGSFFVLLLEDPRGDTWPVDDLFELRRTVREAAIGEGLVGPFYFEFRSPGPEDLADDELEQV